MKTTLLLAHFNFWTGWLNVLMYIFGPVDSVSPWNVEIGCINLIVAILLLCKYTYEKRLNRANSRA